MTVNKLFFLSENFNQSIKKTIKKMSNKCINCNKTVYEMDQVIGCDSVIHKTCFYCMETDCKTKLTVQTYSGVNKKLYCQQHFKEMKSKGSFIKKEEKKEVNKNEKKTPPIPEKKETEKKTPPIPKKKEEKEEIKKPQIPKKTEVYKKEEKMEILINSYQITEDVTVKK
jgi:hypothetical protein